MNLLKKTFFAAAVTLLGAASASADTITTYNFEQITNNGNSDVESQLTVQVIDLGGGQVGFKFFNNVGTASSITDIYFDDGTLLGISTISDFDGAGTGVSFTAPATPGNLPGGGSLVVPFVTTAGFSLDSTNPPVARGVNGATEWVMVTFNLKDSKTYADTLAALAQATGIGGLRIGLHVQGIGGDAGLGGSESFVNTVPDGGLTLSLLGIGLAGMGLIARYTKRA